MPYGAFVGISSNTDGLVHISELSWERIENVEDVLKEGDIIDVKLLAIDEKSGKLKLSRKALLSKPEKKQIFFKKSVTFLRTNRIRKLQNKLN